MPTLFACLRVGVSGAAPLSTSLMDWYKRLGIEILEGYGMSENFAYSHATRSGEAKIGSVGTVSTYVECKISDVGEIMVKSPANMLGYYKEPGLTAEAINSEGFLHTGEKGEIDDKGRLKITGRIKEIFKTSKGKYVAPAPIEDLLFRNSSLEQVCVTGAELLSPIALVTLSEQASKCVASSDSKKQLTAELEELLVDTNNRLDKHERVAAVVVLPEPWTVENNMMTPTLKIKRAEVDKTHQSESELWCGASAKIIFAPA